MLGRLARATIPIPLAEAVDSGERKHGTKGGMVAAGATFTGGGASAVW